MKCSSPKVRAFFPAVFVAFLLCSLSAQENDTLYVVNKKFLNVNRNAIFYSSLNNLMRSSETRIPQSVVRIMDSLGYQSVKCDSSGDTLRIITGPRSRISKMRIAAEPSIPVHDFSFPVLPRFYDAGEINGIVHKIASFLADSGYPYNLVITSIMPDSTGLLEIQFEVEPDQKACFSTPVLRGLKGKRSLFLKDIRFKEGQSYSTHSVNESLRRLRLRKYVSSVDAASPVIVEGSDKKHDSATAVAVPFTIVERSGITLEGAIGYESAASERGRLRGLFNLSLINLFHSGENAEVHYTGARSSQNLKVSLEKPWVLGTPFWVWGGIELDIEDFGYGYLAGEAAASTEIGSNLKTGFALRGSETVPPDSLGSAYTYYGADLFISLISEPFARGKTVYEFMVKTGSGRANREKPYTRSRLEIMAGAHLPLSSRYAIVGRLVAKSLFTDEQFISPAESYRTGGHNSVRGYSEDEFSFRSVFYSQLEGHIYFSPSASLFIFTDCGTGFNSPEGISLSERKDMLGYGAGILFPSRLGTVQLQWARNLNDRRSAGRIHLGLKTLM